MVERDRDLDERCLRGAGLTARSGVEDGAGDAVESAAGDGPALTVWEIRRQMFSNESRPM